MAIPFIKDKYNPNKFLTAGDMFLKMNKVNGLDQLPKAPECCILSPLVKLYPMIEKKVSLEKGPWLIKPIMLHKDKLAVSSNFYGFGAPMWGWFLEQLIFYGIKKFIFIGLFGHYNPNCDRDGVFTVEKSLTDEKTSFHYLPSQDPPWAHPDKKLTEKLLAKGTKPTTLWTIDVMFQQSEAEIEYAKNNNIAGFEMECSAMFNIAKAKKVQMASLKVVSDYFENGKYTSIYSTPDCLNNLNRAIDIALEVFEIKEG